MVRTIAPWDWIRRGDREVRGERAPRSDSILLVQLPPQHLGAASRVNVKVGYGKKNPNDVRSRPKRT